MRFFFSLGSIRLNPDSVSLLQLAKALFARAGRWSVLCNVVVLTYYFFTPCSGCDHGVHDVLVSWHVLHIQIGGVPLLLLCFLIKDSIKR